MQNFHRHGSYDYDNNLNAIRNRESEEMPDGDEDDDENVQIVRDDDVAGVNRQREFLEYFARL